MTTDQPDAVWVEVQPALSTFAKALCTAGGVDPAEDDDIMQCGIFGHEPGHDGACEACGAPDRRP